MRRLLALSLLSSTLLACPDEGPPALPPQATATAPPATTATTATTPPATTPATPAAPKLDLGQLQGEPAFGPNKGEPSAADKALLDDPRALEKLFEKPCGADPAEVKCKR